MSYKSEFIAEINPLKDMRRFRNYKQVLSKPTTDPERGDLLVDIVCEGGLYLFKPHLRGLVIGGLIGGLTSLLSDQTMDTTIAVAYFGRDLDRFQYFWRLCYNSLILFMGKILLNLPRPLGRLGANVLIASEL